jgi:hypothetical protein
MTPTPNTLPKEDTLKLATLLFEHTEGQIKAADSKAWLTVAANTLLANLFKDINRGMVYTLLHPPSPLHWGAALFTLLMFGSILGSVLFALLVVKPSLASPGSGNLFFFGNIQRQPSRDAFITAFQNQRPEDISAALLAQVYSKAKIAYRKFNALTISLYFFFATLGFWAVAQLLSTAIKA